MAFCDGMFSTACTARAARVLPGFSAGAHVIVVHAQPVAKACPELHMKHNTVLSIIVNFIDCHTRFIVLSWVPP